MQYRYTYAKATLHVVLLLLVVFAGAAVCQVQVAAAARAACMSQLVYDNVEVMVEICQEKDLAAAFNPTGGEHRQIVWAPLPTLPQN